MTACAPPLSLPALTSCPTDREWAGSAALEADLEPWAELPLTPNSSGPAAALPPLPWRLPPGLCLALALILHAGLLALGPLEQQDANPAPPVLVLTWGAPLPGPPGGLPDQAAAAAGGPAWPAPLSPTEATPAPSAPAAPPTPVETAAPPAAQRLRQPKATNRPRPKPVPPRPAPTLAEASQAADTGGLAAGPAPAGIGDGTSPGGAPGAPTGTGVGNGGRGGGGGGVWEEGAVEVPPRLLHRQDPGYPMTARRRGIEGVVTARLLVGPDGGVQQMTIESASPAGVFEEAVAEALPRWRFAPGQHQGRAVAVWVRVPIRFQLR